MRLSTPSIPDPPFTSPIIMSNIVSIKGESKMESEE